MSSELNFENKNMVNVVAGALFFKQDKTYLLARRSQSQSGAGQWEFPGGKIEDGETQRVALSRELMEELQMDINHYKMSFFSDEVIQFNLKVIKISLWIIHIDDTMKPVISLVDHDDHGWFKLEELEMMNISKADRNFISLLKS